TDRLVGEPDVREEERQPPAEADQGSPARRVATHRDDEQREPEDRHRPPVPLREGRVREEATEDRGDDRGEPARWRRGHAGQDTFPEPGHQAPTGPRILRSAAPLLGPRFLVNARAWSVTARGEAPLQYKVRRYRWRPVSPSPCRRRSRASAQVSGLRRVQVFSARPACRSVCPGRVWVKRLPG